MPRTQVCAKEQQVKTTCCDVQSSDPTIFNPDWSNTHTVHKQMIGYIVVSVNLNFKTVFTLKAARLCDSFHEA